MSNPSESRPELRLAVGRLIEILVGCDTDAVVCAKVDGELFTVAEFVEEHRTNFPEGGWLADRIVVFPQGHPL